MTGDLATISRRDTFKLWQNLFLLLRLREPAAPKVLLRLLLLGVMSKSKVVSKVRVEIMHEPILT